MTLTEYKEKINHIFGTQEYAHVLVESTKKTWEQIRCSYPSMQEGKTESDHFLNATYALSKRFPVNADFIEVLGQTYSFCSHPEAKKLAYLDRTFLRSQQMIEKKGCESVTKMVQYSQRYTSYEKRLQAYYIFCSMVMPQDFDFSEFNFDQLLDEKVRKYEIKRSVRPVQ